MRSLLGDPREIFEMSLGPPSAGHDGVPSETSFAFANLTVEPASRNGMSAAAQAVGASARTRLGHGPRAKAHVDYGAWSRGRLDGSRDTRSNASEMSASHNASGRRDTSQSRGATTSLKTPYGVRLDAHNRLDAFGYGTANVDGTDHDKSAFVNGSLVSDLLTSLEALGGARPHPAATLIKKCVASHEDAHGAGGTWSLVLGTSLCGAADTLRDTHGMDARSILDAFQEATYLIAAWVVPRLCATAREAAAAFPADALDATVAEARARIRPRLEPGTVSVADARVIAALILGLDRGRHPGDAPLALAAALTLARRRRRNGKESDGADGEGGGEDKQNATRRATASCDGLQSQNIARLRLDHRDAAVGMVIPGPCASRSFLVPGAVLPVDESATSRGVADALAEATKRAADERFDFALLLDDEALAEEDVDDVARAVTDAIFVRLTSLEKKPTFIRLVLFRSDETREARVAALARALECFQKKHQKTHPPLVAVAGPGVKRATLRALARTIGGAVVLDARAVEPGDLARSVRVSCAAAGWDTDDSAEPTRRASRRASDAPRRFATVSLEDGEEEKRLRRKTRLTASLVLFDRTETAANARAAEFRRTMRRVSHALACPFSREAEASRGGAARVSDWSLLFPVFLEDDDDDDDDGRKRSEEEDVFAASMARVKVSVWRVAWAALADAEPAAPRLEEARARVAGLHTAMGVARCVVAAGPVVTRGELFR